MKKIWYLFSIANDYNQPSNNLEAWWSNKPDFFNLTKILNIDADSDKGNTKIGKILKGEEVRINGYDYRLEEIEECIRLEEGY